jgi:hypothetical protein
MKRKMILLIIAVVSTLSISAFADTYTIPPDADVSFESPGISAQFGYTVVLGDLNNDGYDDIIVAAPYFIEPNPRFSFGRVIVYWGNSDNDYDLVIRTDATSADYSWQFGDAMAVCDVNGDGIDDLVGSSPGAWGDFGNGVVWVVYGRSDWTGVTELILNPDAETPELLDVQIYRDNLYPQVFASSIACGDVDNDGYDDIVFNEMSYLSQKADGVVHVVAGDAFSTGTEIFLTDSPDLHYVWTEFTAPTVAVGDVNGDVYKDILIGMFEIFGQESAGEVFVYFGDTDYIDNTDITVNSTTADVTLIGEADYSSFGYAIAVGDLTGDGIGDIIVSAPNLLIGRKALADGTVFVLNGRMNFTAHQVFDFGATDADVKINGEVGLKSGMALAVGDWDGDCIDDLLIGATSFSQSDLWNKAFLLLGGSLPASLDLPDDAYNILQSEQELQMPNNLFATALAMGHVNNDVVDDILIGAPYFYIPPNKEPTMDGMAYLIYSDEVNAIPTAGAGPDQSVNVNDTVTLTGAASADTEGHALTYAWSQVSGASVTLSAPDEMITTFVPTQAGTYVFELVVNDCLQDSDPDEVTVTVSDIDDDTDDDTVVDDDSDDDTGDDDITDDDVADDDVTDDDVIDDDSDDDAGPLDGGDATNPKLAGSGGCGN